MKIKLREYQREAITAIEKNLNSGNQRLIVQMIVGSGLHITCFYALEKLIETYRWKNIRVVAKNYEFLSEFMHISHLFDFEDSNIIYSTIDSLSPQNDSSDNEILILINLDLKSKIISDYIDNFKGIVILFTNIIEENNLQKYAKKNMIFAYKYTLQDIFKNKISDTNYFHSHVNNEQFLNNISTVNELTHSTVNEPTLKYESSDTLSKDDSSEIISKALQISYRKEQVDYFKRLLDDDDFFDTERVKNGGNTEGVWQNFFEKNDWTLGFSMSGILYSSLNDRKLEQVVSGFDFNQSGKRIDALMKSKGYIESFCCVEIKTHKTPLLGTQYRGECWSPSTELMGAISQIQKTVQKLMKNIHEKTEIKDEIGNPTGEVIFNYMPYSFVIIGSLKEFDAGNGRINLPKLSSFELFRKNLKTPEIITFDEIYERVRFLAID